MPRASGVYEVWCRENHDPKEKLFSYWNGEFWNGPWCSAKYVCTSFGSMTPWTMYKVGKRVSNANQAASPKRRLLVLLCKR